MTKKNGGGIMRHKYRGGGGGAGEVPVKKIKCGRGREKNLREICWRGGIKNTKCGGGTIWRGDRSHQKISERMGKNLRGTPEIGVKMTKCGKGGRENKN